MQTKKILDVGGNHNTYKGATHIIDIRPKPKGCNLDYTRMDICNSKWPFKDKEFDFVWCSQTLEDVKDPMSVCKEIMRVGKAGKIIIPSVLSECTIGIDVHHGKEKYAGYCHHRWLCFPIKDKGIKFVQKTPITHIFDWTSHISQEQKMKQKDAELNWEDKFEVLELVSTSHWFGLYNILKDEFHMDPLKNCGLGNITGK